MTQGVAAKQLAAILIKEHFYPCWALGLKRHFWNDLM